jgi:hypothetical protein
MAQNPPLSQFPFPPFLFFTPFSKEWREIRDLFVDVNEKVLAPLDASDLSLEQAIPFFLFLFLTLSQPSRPPALSHTDSHYPPPATHAHTISLPQPFSCVRSPPTLNPKP